MKAQSDFTGNLRAPFFGTKRLWPFKADEMSPLTWWRTLPPAAFDKAERISLRMTLEKIEMLRADDDFKAALKGDPATATAVIFQMSGPSRSDSPPPPGVEPSLLLTCAPAVMSSGPSLKARSRRPSPPGRDAGRYARRRGRASRR